MLRGNPGESMGASAGRPPIVSSNACGGHSNGRSLREPRQNNLLPTRVRHSAKAGIGGEPKWRERQALTEVADPLRPPKTIGGRGRIPREKLQSSCSSRCIWRKGSRPSNLVVPSHSLLLARSHRAGLTHSLPWEPFGHTRGIGIIIRTEISG